MVYYIPICIVIQVVKSTTETTNRDKISLLRTGLSLRGVALTCQLLCKNMYLAVDLNLHFSN